jgi:hypothetical protein
MPASNPERMIFVGLVGELGGEEEALLLEGKLENLASVARAAQLEIKSADDAARYSHFAFYVTEGEKAKASLSLEAVEETAAGWRVVAKVEPGGARKVVVGRDGSVTIG